MDTLKFIFYFLMMIFVFFTMIKSFKIQRKERKEYVAKLKREGKAATPKQAIFYFFVTFGGLYVIGIIITLIIFHIKKIAFRPSRIFPVAAVAVIFELGIGGTIWVIMDFAQRWRKEGAKTAILVAIISAILLVVVMYVRYCKFY